MNDLKGIGLIVWRVVITLFVVFMLLDLTKTQEISDKITTETIVAERIVLVDSLDNPLMFIGSNAGKEIIVFYNSEGENACILGLDTTGAPSLAFRNAGNLLSLNIRDNEYPIITMLPGGDNGYMQIGCSGDNDKGMYLYTDSGKTELIVGEKGGMPRVWGYNNDNPAFLLGVFDDTPYATIYDKSGNAVWWKP